jgi:cholesterol 25-hydroxylase
MSVPAILPLEAPTSRRLVVELVATFLIYDAIFLLFHIALYKILSLRNFHAPHHAHYAHLNPQLTDKTSCVERRGLVLLVNFSLNIIKSHVLTRTLFAPMFEWLFVEYILGRTFPGDTKRFYHRVGPEALGKNKGTL